MPCLAPATGPRAIHLHRRSPERVARRLRALRQREHGNPPDSTAPGTDAAPDVTATPEPDGAASPANDAAADAALDAGSSKAPIGSCSAPVQIDIGNTVPPLSVAQFGARYLITWTQNSNRTADSVDHLKGRWFDGTTLQPEIDFGTDYPYARPASVDTTGKAFVLVPQAMPSMVGRLVFDLTTGTYNSSTAAFTITDQTSYNVGALPQGAVAVYQVGTTTEVVDSYANGAWSNSDAGADAATFPTTRNANIANVALNAAGKGAVYWVVETASSVNTLNVAAFDGVHAGTPVTRVFDSSAGTGMNGIDGVAFTNGDIAFAWNLAGPTNGARFAVFHPSAAAGAQWDPDTALYDSASDQSRPSPLLLADADDNITAIRTSPTEETTYNRRMGGTWGSAQVLGPTYVPTVAALDPAGDVVALTMNGATGPSIARMPKNGTTFSALVPTGLPGTNAEPVLIFDTAGDPLVAGWGTSKFDVFTTTCTTAP